MQFSLHFSRRLSLTALFSLLLLLILDIAIATPLPQNGVGVKSLAARGVQGTQITLDEYIAYLKQYYPDTDKYIEYSGGSKDQVENFQKNNPGYYYYEDFFDGDTSAHFYTAFPLSDDRLDDGEASSEAISKVATKQITVFGAVEYQTEEGKSSFYTNFEAPSNIEGVKSGRLESINHMVKDATDPSQILAKEDGEGVITYQPGYEEGTPNASPPIEEPSTSNPDSDPESDPDLPPYGDPANKETTTGEPTTTPDHEPISDPPETPHPAPTEEFPEEIHI